MHIAYSFFAVDWCVLGWAGVGNLGEAADCRPHLNRGRWSMYNCMTIQLNK